MSGLPLAQALGQRSWRAECRNCPFLDVTPAATLRGPRHSKDTGHEVMVEVVLSGTFIGGVAR